MLEGFSGDVSHQEIERILSEVETWYFVAFDQASVEWLPLAGITNFLFNDLGYEDIDEFEDAISGSFTDFLSAFPHMELKKEGEGESEKWFIKIKKMEPGPPRKLEITIEDSKQLLNTTLMKYPDARILIPEIEFEIGEDQKRRIDSLYNYIVKARDDLENHAKMLGETAEAQGAILGTVKQLSAYLDVEKPFTVVVDDVTGQCEFKVGNQSDKLGVRTIEQPTTWAGPLEPTSTPSAAAERTWDLSGTPKTQGTA